MTKERAIEPGEYTDPTTGAGLAANGDLERCQVVIVHDYLTQRGGAERVVLDLLKAFPGAVVLTSIYDPDRTFHEFRSHDIRTLWLSKVPLFRYDPRLAVLLLGRAFRRANVPAADIVICSSSGWAHGVDTTAPKIVYCHNPARWLYQPGEYLPHMPWPFLELATRLLAPYRRRDRLWALEARSYLANSAVVKSRIENAYGITPTVMHPAIGINYGETTAVRNISPGYFLSVGRARGYKQTHLLVEAFRSLPQHRLVVVGGSDAPRDAPNIRAVGRVSDSELRWLYQHCVALIAVGYEDFGLTPLEANLFGKPVIARRCGGYVETVIESVTGTFVSDLSENSLAAAMNRIEPLCHSTERIQRHAESFSKPRFIEMIRSHVFDILASQNVPA